MKLRLRGSAGKTDGQTGHTVRRSVAAPPSSSVRPTDCPTISVDHARVSRLCCKAMPEERLIVRGARVHNLRNITVEIPRNRLTVITGLSGSGKSSLAFDTIYAEGQRRYVESLSAYAR